VRIRTLSLARVRTVSFARMSISAALLFLLTTSAAVARSAQGGGRLLCAFLQETPRETAILDAVTRWKIINTALFVIGLGWLLAKYAPRFFNARSADIQKAIQDATGLRIEAEFRYSEIDRKMATLADEIRKMREQAATAMERAHQRFRHETGLEVEHIRHNTQAEIEALRKEAADHLRRHTAQLALDVAERRLRERFVSEDPTPLIDDFIRLLERGNERRKN
jgi:F-type H+-transporting ATPase subunit b